MSELKHVVVGNYLNRAGHPVVATQMSSAEPKNVLGGWAVAAGWVARWIKAASEDSVTEVFLSGGDSLKWDHGRTRHLLGPDEWVVWDGSRFVIVPADAFADDYSPVIFERGEQ